MGLMFGDAIAETLPRLQAHAESMMRDTCTIARPGGYDRDGVEQSPATIYTGMAKERAYRGTTDPQAGGQELTVQHYEQHLPAVDRMAGLVAAGVVTCDLARMPVREGDVVTRTTLGRPSITMTVTGDHDVTFQTAQRVPVDRVG